MTLLTLKEVKSNLTTVDFSKLPKPTKKNKGYRGQLLELAVGIENSSNLCDMVDGELKSFTRGQSIAVTQLNHALPEIEKNVPFKDTVVGKKLDNTLYVSFSKENEYLSSKEISSKNDPEHFSKLEQDYNDIKDIIRNAIKERKQLKTITGRNKILQIRTSGSKKSDGTYTPLKYNGHQLKDKYMRFYITGKYAKKEIS